MENDIILSSISDLDRQDKILSDDLFLVTSKDKNGVYVSNKVDFSTLSSTFGLKSASFHDDTDFAAYYHEHNRLYSKLGHVHDGRYSQINHTHSEYLSVIPQASDTVIGGFKTGFSESDTLRAVKINNGTAYVSLPNGKAEGHIMMSKVEYDALPYEQKLSDVVYMLSDDNDILSRCVGVIDGTYYRRTEKQAFAISNTPQHVYTVLSDCLLYVVDDGVDANNDYPGISYWLDNEKKIPIHTGLSGTWLRSFLVPIKSGSKIYSTVNSGDFGGEVSVAITFIEYKLINGAIQPSPQSDCVSYVIETGKFSSKDGTKHEIASENDSWYRLYSDGWCEQGGHTKIEGVSTVADIQLFKSYRDLSYITSATNIRMNEEEYQSPRLGSYPYVDSKTINTIRFNYNAGDYQGDISWKSEGFIN